MKNVEQETIFWPILIRHGILKSLEEDRIMMLQFISYIS